MTVTFDPRRNIAYLRFKEKRDTVRSIPLSDELIIDIGSDGMIYGIELLNANEQLKRDNGGKVSVINEATGKREEISLDF